MNCKPCDLAMIIGGLFPENYGGLVKVLEKSFLPYMDWEIELLQHTKATILGVENVFKPGEIAHARDKDLRPIRDSDGQDETLTWAPKKVTA